MLLHPRSVTTLVCTCIYIHIYVWVFIHMCIYMWLVHQHIRLCIQKLKRIRMFDLSDAVRPLEESQLRTMTVETFKRILTTES